MRALSGGLKAIALLTAVVVWCSPGIAMAQIRSHGYIVGAVGGGSRDLGSTIVQFGVGGEKVWSRGFGIGTEGGYLKAVGLTTGGGFWSFNLTQQFHRTSSRMVPFATGGISLIAGSISVAASSIHSATDWAFGWNFASPSCNRVVAMGRLTLPVSALG